ncbi:hypothetical protein ACPCHT_00570 [Nucisporomicrobium flavum]|jgi:hypothetical protein|uniref:hypothetical protein n=1 Tax=Nucisporomicrobium flavum TaxID=2785915 RepID=UPI0018F721A8|nr:hypothetical protein [Nucisporomicrobium flavum]
MSADVSKRRPAPAARRFGYTVAAAVNVVLLYLINVRPGWDAVAFLTPDTTLVLGLVNASLIVGLVVDALQFVHDPPWMVALGSLTTTAVGIAVMVRLWQVFPFDFADAAVAWGTVVRVVLAVGIAGSIIALVVQVVALFRAMTHLPPAGCDPAPHAGP